MFPLEELKSAAVNDAAPLVEPSAAALSMVMFGVGPPDEFTGDEAVTSVTVPAPVATAPQGAQLDPSE
jgi:hypothetical protein